MRLVKAGKGESGERRTEAGAENGKGAEVRVEAGAGKGEAGEERAEAKLERVRLVNDGEDYSGLKNLELVFFKRALCQKL